MLTSQLFHKIFLKLKARPKREVVTVQRDRKKILLTMKK